MTSFVTRFDFRAPGLDADGRRELYERALEQSAYVDEHGQDALMLSEHHASDDGYLPSPLIAAAAVAARTKRVPITVSALLVNLYEPLKLAEDISVLDHGGRVSFTLGLGYRREEYALFDRPWETRGADIEEKIELLLALWAGSEVVHDGRVVRVTPMPLTRPHPFLFYGGGSPAAARRAARLGLGFQPQSADKGLRDLYLAECERLGREPGFVMLPPPGPANEMNSVVLDDATTVEELRDGERYAVLTPDDLVQKCRDREIRMVSSHPLCAGLPPEPSWESLRLICESVLPALRAPATEPQPTTT